MYYIFKGDCWKIICIQLLFAKYYTKILRNRTNTIVTDHNQYIYVDKHARMGNRHCVNNMSILPREFKKKTWLI